MTFSDFCRQNILCLILGITGFVLIFMTYIALIKSKLKGKYISGFPAIGGTLVFFAFLTTSYKMLCLLSLLDYGIWTLIFFVFPKTIKESLKKRNKLFPDKIDGANVLFFTKYRSEYDNIKVKEKNINIYRVYYINYYAITVNNKNNNYNLIGCDNDFNVLTKAEFDSIEICKKNVNKPLVKWIKK